MTASVDGAPRRRQVCVRKTRQRRCAAGATAKRSKHGRSHRVLAFTASSRAGSRDASSLRTPLRKQLHFFSHSSPHSHTPRISQTTKLARIPIRNAAWQDSPEEGRGTCAERGRACLVDISYAAFCLSSNSSSFIFVSLSPPAELPTPPSVSSARHPTAPAA